MVRNALLLTDAVPRLRKGSVTKKLLNRGRLLRILETKRIVTGIRIDAQARLTIDHVGWEEYWLPVKLMGQTDELLRNFEAVWSVYIDGGFPAAMRREYCLRYFQLLDAVIDCWLTDPTKEIGSVALRQVVGFESFIIISFLDTGDEAAAAATSTVRNPAYLLTKVRIPGALDSGEHLPLILPASPSKPMLYYHYRQHRLSRDSDISLLSYLAVNNKIRAASFGAISMLEKGVADSTDPFAAERAVRLARAGILDYLQAWCVAHGNVEVVPVDLIDLGAGSGLVAARLCRLIGSALSDIGRSPRFRIRFVDLLMSEPTRFFTSEGIEKYIDSIEVAGVDYRQWLAHGLVFPNCDGVRIVLISRFFNNLSDFGIHSWKPDAYPCCAGELPAKGALEYTPTYCLAPNGPGPEQLVVSNTRIWLGPGRAFKQYSLSPYFLGLQMSAGSNPESIRFKELNESIHLPVRTFRPDCLLTQAGNSILGELARQSTLVVVQDADIRPQDLKMHARKAHLEDLMALDTSRAAGLRGHFSYLIASRTDPAMRHVGGKRLW